MFENIKEIVGKIDATIKTVEKDIEENGLEAHLEKVVKELIKIYMR